MNETTPPPQKKKSERKPYILLIVVAVVLVYLVAFSLLNTQQVRVSFVVAETDTSLILVMLVSAGLGLVLGILGTALLRHRHHRHHKNP